MSVSVTEAQVMQYQANVLHLAQQKMSKLRPTVQWKDKVVGKSVYFDRIGITEAAVKSGRHVATPANDTPHSRRRADLVTYHWGDVVDSDDEVRLLIDPASQYTRAGGAAMARAIDRIIVAAATATARTGEEGAGSETWPITNREGNSHQIAHGAAGLTKAKIVTARTLLYECDVPDEEKCYFIYSPRACEDLLNDTTLTSADYLAVKALQVGNFDREWMGFQWVRSTLLTKSGTTRSCLAYSESALGLGIGMDVKSKIQEDPSISFATRVYFEMVFGSVRVDGERIVEVQITE